MDFSVAVRVLRDRYSVFQDPTPGSQPGKEYSVRFKQLGTQKTIQGMTHDRGTMLNGRFIAQILERFDVPVPDFLEAVAEGKKLPGRSAQP